MTRVGLSSHTRRGLEHNRWLGRTYYFFDQLPSTNDEARQRAEAGAPHGTLVIADQQTAGRGRRGRPWLSPPAVNIYLSVVLRPQVSPSQAAPMSLAAAVAVAQAAAQVIQKAPTVKWPNDLLYQGKKLCGILLEMASQGSHLKHLILGLGLNVNQEAWSGALQEHSTSLAQQASRRLSRGQTLVALCQALEHWIDRFAEEGVAPILKAWSDLAPWLGQTVTVASSQGHLAGKALGLDPGGGLKVELPDGTERVIAAGEVMF